MRSIRHLRAATALALAATTLTANACHSWRAVALPAAAPEAQERAVRGPVRATRADGERLVLAEARIAGDTLRGLPARRASGEVRVPLDSVRRLEARRFSPVRTVVLAGGVFVGLMALVIAGLAAAGPGFPTY